MTSKRRRSEQGASFETREPWDPPHEDAEHFLLDYVRYMCDLHEPQEDFKPPDLGWREWCFFRSTGGTAFLRPEGHVQFQEDLDWEYEQHSRPDGTKVFINEMADDAARAITDRDMDAYMDAIEAIIDAGWLWGSIPDLSVDRAYNWMEVIDLPEQADDHNEDDHSDVRRAVVEAVRELACRLCELIAANPDALMHVEWRQMEFVVATALGEIGMRTTITRGSKDGGKDVIATCMLRGREQVFYIEIKHWRSGKRVGSRKIFDFIEVNLRDGTDGGLYLSTSGYTNTIHGRLAEVSRQSVALGGANKIVTLCQHFVRKRRGIWVPEQPLPEILYEHTLGSSGASTASAPTYC